MVIKNEEGKKLVIPEFCLEKNVEFGNV